MGNPLEPPLLAPIGWPAPCWELIGGKALALCQLAGAGFPVPRGAVLTTAAYVASNDVPLPPKTRTALRTALDWICKIGPVPIAVRSSTLEEDGTRTAFAGQYLTELNVHGEAQVEAAVRRCWSSARSPRVAAYRQRRSTASENTAIAVILQEFIPATAAGVLFTADPLSGDRAQVLIEAGYGLGETVVRGEIVPDRYWVERRTGVVKESLSDKAVMAVPGAEGIRRLAVDAEARRKPALSASMARTLMQLGLAAEALIGRPLDIEWASYENRLYMLQARPITTLTAPNDKHDNC